MISLEGKIAVVTGSARGIGNSIAMKLANLGADVIISDVIDCDDAVKGIESLGRKSFAVKADVSKEEDVKHLIDQSIEKFGRIDIFVNNAGITKDTLAMRMSEEDWDKVITINLKGTFLCTKSILKPMMKQKSGKIINIASVIGLIGNAGQVNYSASKAGVIALTKSIAQEVGSRNINVNAIAPGFIETAMTKETINEKMREDLINRIPLKRFGSSEDVSNIVAFLASEQADYITGQVFVVDGGLTMTG